VRRTTIRKRMRAKLRQVKQQLRERMHDPVPQTGAWLQSVVQGYFNYYAVPGNLASLGVFRDRVLVLWWRALRRRSQKHRVSCKLNRNRHYIPEWLLEEWRMKVDPLLIECIHAGSVLSNLIQTAPVT